MSSGVRQHRATARRAPSKRQQHPKHSRLAQLLVVFAFLAYTRPQGLTGTHILIAGAALTAITMLGHPAAVPRLRLPLLPMLFVLVAVSSATVSEMPQTTLTGAVALLVPLGAASLVSQLLPFEHFLIVADRTLFLAVLASLSVGLIAPNIGITQRAVNEGSLRGIYDHRNVLAYVITLATITFMARHFSDGYVRFDRYWGRIIFYILALVWTGSVAGGALFLLNFIAIMVMLAARKVGNGTEREASALLTVAHLAVAGLLVAGFSWRRIIDWFDRGESIEGRIEIWHGALEAWREAFWRGYGWNTLFSPDSEAARTLTEHAGYAVRSVHNGYLAVGLQVGLIGLVIGVLLLLRLLQRAGGEALNRPSALSFWTFQVTLTLAVADVLETRAFVNIGWFLLCIAVFYLRDSRSSFAPGHEVKLRADR